MKMNNLSLHVPGGPGSRKRLGTRKHRPQSGLSPLSPVSPGIFDQVATERGLCRLCVMGHGERSRMYEYFMTSKRTRDTGDTRDNQPWERSSAVPSVKMSQGTNGFYRGQQWLQRPFCPILFPGNSGTPSHKRLDVPAGPICCHLLAGWLLSSSVHTSINLWFNSDSAPVSRYRAMKILSSTAIPTLVPLSRPHYGMEQEAYQATNARNQMPYRSERPMNRRLLFVPGVAAGWGAFSDCLCA